MKTIKIKDLKDNRITEWVSKKTVSKENIPVYVVKNGTEIEECLAEHKGGEFAVVAPSRTDSGWWEETVGAYNPNVFFLKGRPKGSSVGRAVILYNVISETEYRLKTTPELITILTNMGINYKGIADRINVERMVITRNKILRSNFKKHHDLDNSLVKLIMSEKQKQLVKE